MATQENDLLGLARKAFEVVPDLDDQVDFQDAMNMLAEDVVHGIKTKDQLSAICSAYLAKTSGINADDFEPLSQAGCALAEFVSAMVLEAVEAVAGDQDDLDDISSRLPAWIC